MKKLLTIYRSFDRRHRVAVWLGGAVLFYTLAGFLIVPPIVKMVLEKKLPELLQRPVKIESLRLNPYTLSLTIEAFRIDRKDGAAALFAFDRLYINLESLSLFKKALVIKAIALEGPTINVTRIDGEQFNFTDLLAGSSEDPSQPAGSGSDEPLLFSVNNIEISRGDIRFADLPKETNHHIRDLTIAIPSLSNLPVDVEVSVEPRFAAVINDTPLELTGGSKPFAESKTTELELKMAGIVLPEYLAYIPNPTGLTLKSALLDLDTSIGYQLADDGAAKLSLTGSVGLREFEIVDRQGVTYLQWPSVTVVIADSNLLAGEVHLAEIRIEAPAVELVRTAKGEIMPLALLAAREAASAPEETATAAEETAAAAGPPLQLTIDRVRLNGGHVGFDDRMLAKPARLSIDEIALSADGLTTVEGQAGALAVSMALNRTGTFKLDGSLEINPPKLNAGIELQKLALKGFQPYISEQARLVVGGDFAVNGELDVSGGASQAIGFRGDVALTGLKVVTANKGGDLLKCRALEVKGIRYASSPASLVLGEIRLRAPSLDIRVEQDGRLNIANLTTQKSSAAPPPDGEAASGEEAPLPVVISRVRLDNGEVAFQDRNIEPNYGFKVDQLQGTINGLSSDPAVRADLAFTARVDQQAPLSISGKLNPLSSDPFADIILSFKDFNLPPLSPYTGKYAGYKTDKGKLQLDLAYHVEGRHLESSNRVFLDQFTLGESVDSPDATSLPVGLAISLLKNRAGEIDLDIPVKGDLDDPEFSVAGVVVQVVVNLITKAATSPFALLGALIPEGEDIEHIPFDAGASELNDAALGKLAVVANVLHERPGLKMELAGHVDPEADRQALARQKLLQLVVLEKTGRSGTDAGTVAVSAEEYPKYLRRAYETALDEAPRAVRKAQAQLESGDPVAEKQRMESFLLAGIDIDDSALRLLAIDRANRVLGHLVETGKVEAERLFAVEPDLEAAADSDASQPLSQVQLLIR